MDYGGLATLIATIFGAVGAFLGWRLSKHVQKTAVQRQTKMDESKQEESVAKHERELRVWLRGEIDAREVECEREKETLRKVAAYWRGRAVGSIRPDDTPPPEVYGGI